MFYCFRALKNSVIKQPAEDSHIFWIRSGMDSKPEHSDLCVGFLLSSPSTGRWSCSNFKTVSFIQWYVGRKIHPYLPSCHNSCGIAKSTACIVEQLFISLGCSCVYSRVCVSGISHDYTPCIYICGWSPRAVKASGQRNETENASSL